METCRRTLPDTDMAADGILVDVHDSGITGAADGLAREVPAGVRFPLRQVVEDLYGICGSHQCLYMVRYDDGMGNVPVLVSADSNYYMVLLFARIQSSVSISSCSLSQVPPSVYNPVRPPRF